MKSTCLISSLTESAPRHSPPSRSVIRAAVVVADLLAAVAIVFCISVPK